MKQFPQYVYYFAIAALFSCESKKDNDRFNSELQAISLVTGDIALCGAEDGRFGKVEFGLSCEEKVRANFNLASALLHSFEYAEAEKIFAKVINGDRECLMA
jgi:hypothetical protein